jgi:hypothetical protein
MPDRWPSLRFCGFKLYTCISIYSYFRFRCFHTGPVTLLWTSLIIILQVKDRSTHRRTGLHCYVELPGRPYDFCFCKYPWSSLQMHLYINIYRVSQEECARLREGVPYVKVCRYNPKHYVQSWTVTEIMAREKCGLLAGPRTVPVSWQVLSMFVLGYGVRWRLALTETFMASGGGHFEQIL